MAKEINVLFEIVSQYKSPIQKSCIIQPADQLLIPQMQRIVTGSGKCFCAAACLSVPISPGMCMQCNLICLSLAVLSNAGSQPYSHSTNQLLSRQKPSGSTLCWVLVSLKVSSIFYPVTLHHCCISSGLKESFLNYLYL